MTDRRGWRDGARRRRTGGGSHPGALAGVLMTVTALVAAGCGGRGASLGTTSTPCFHALPTAAATVSHRGRLAGVRLVPLDRLRRRAPEIADLGPGKVCLVAFEGHFSRADVGSTLPAGRSAGRYAVVVVTTDGRRVLGSLITEHLPLPFRHPV